MKKPGCYVVLLLLLLLSLQSLSAVASTAPAFLWSPHLNRLSSNNKLNYQTISPKDLANSVLSQGGWSDILCSDTQSSLSVDVALVFVGKELQSSHISGNKHADPALVNLLKDSFTSSNFSLAFPYISAPEDSMMESLLVSEFREACGNDLRISNVAISESCMPEDGDFLKLADLHSVQDHLLSRMENTPKEQADLIVFCNRGSHSMEQLDQPRPESEVISELIASLDKSGAKYAVLYVSDPVRSIQYPSHRELERFLAEGTAGNVSANSTSCDEVCQLKTSLLEGLFVVSRCLCLFSKYKLKLLQFCFNVLHWGSFCNCILFEQIFSPLVLSNELFRVTFLVCVYTRYTLKRPGFRTFTLP
ncbi:hypothetical protein Ddye_023333 [Dipteronia dyeriana]|uniref:Transmembrane protein n=1 Tax=Dipteronia dyeriana TaxID=168575 RepID=A0AAD9TSP5_9ROSI|nr:hypothetical protein Ddye_023333 [Dipteronia dyeriana]